MARSDYSGLPASSAKMAQRPNSQLSKIGIQPFLLPGNHMDAVCSFRGSPSPLTYRIHLYSIAVDIEMYSPYSHVQGSYLLIIAFA
jgi:hypothetical protein